MLPYLPHLPLLSEVVEIFHQLSRHQSGVGNKAKKSSLVHQETMWAHSCTKACVKLTRSKK